MDEDIRKELRRIGTELWELGFESKREDIQRPLCRAIEGVYEAAQAIMAAKEGV